MNIKKSKEQKKDGETMRKIYVSEKVEKSVDKEELLVVKVEYSKTHDTKWIAWIR